MKVGFLLHKILMNNFQVCFENVFPQGNNKQNPFSFLFLIFLNIVLPESFVHAFICTCVHRTSGALPCEPVMLVGVVHVLFHVYTTSPKDYTMCAAPSLQACSWAGIRAEGQSKFYAQIHKTAASSKVLKQMQKKIKYMSVV